MKSANQKGKLLYVKRIFENETDENHGITMKRILELLAMHGIAAERKSVYSDIEILREEFGMDIDGPRGRNKEYRLQSRTYELPELKMIIDAMQASKFLSAERTKRLIGCLEKECSRFERESIRHEVVIANRVKATNKSIFYATDAIHKGISTNRRISFRYFKLDHELSKVYYTDKVSGTDIYTVSPWKLIYTDDFYYLLAFHDGKEKHFRIDRMESVTVLENEPREHTEEFSGIDISNYTKYTFNMYGGEIRPVTIIFRKTLLSVVYDRFGTDVLVMNEDEENYRITVKVAVSQQFFGWVFGLGTDMRIAGPEDVVKKMEAVLRDVAEVYHNS